jgi:hypothetical protein
MKYWLANNFDLINRPYSPEVTFVGPNDFDFVIVDARVENFDPKMILDLPVNKILVIDPERVIDDEDLQKVGGFDITRLDDKKMYDHLEQAFAWHQFAPVTGSQNSLIVEQKIVESKFDQSAVSVISKKSKTIGLYIEKLDENSIDRSVLAFRQLKNLFPKENFVLLTDSTDEATMISNRIDLYISNNLSYFSDQEGMIDEYLNQYEFDDVLYFDQLSSKFAKKIKAKKLVDFSTKNNDIDFSYVFGLPGLYDGSARKNIIIDTSNVSDKRLSALLDNLSDVMNANPDVFVVLIRKNNFEIDKLIKIAEQFNEKLSAKEVYDPDYVNLDGSPKTNHEEKVTRITVAYPTVDSSDNAKSDSFIIANFGYSQLVKIVEDAWIAVIDDSYRWLLNGLIDRQPVVTFNFSEVEYPEYFEDFLRYFDTTGMSKRTLEKSKILKQFLESDDKINQLKKSWQEVL